MAWFPISGVPPQIQKANTGFANDFRLKFYRAGTNTPIQVAFNQTATDELNQPLTVDSVRINEFGYTVNTSGGVAIPHVEIEYKIVLYKNATDANANDTNRADFVVDYCKPGLIGFVESGGENSAALITYLASPTVDISDVQTKLRKWIDVRDYGAIGNGSTDDSVAISTALTENDTVYFPAGTYVTSGIEVNAQNKTIIFGGDVTLRASANDTILFHQQTSNCRHMGSFTVDSAGRSGVIGLVCGPADLSDTSTLSNTDFNWLPGVIGNASDSAAAQELVVFQNGPTGASTCSHNVLPQALGKRELRSVLLNDAASSGGSVPLSNVFYNIRGVRNTCLQINAGQRNVFYSVQCATDEDASPNSTPTGIRMLGTSPVTTVAVQDNYVYGANFVSCTRDIDLGNELNWIEGDPDPAKSLQSSTRFNQQIRFGFDKVLHGEILANGNSAYLPAGWSSTRLSTGNYEITHTMGGTTYAVVATCLSSTNVKTARIGSRTDTSFQLNWRENDSSSGDVAQDTDFFFIVYER